MEHTASLIVISGFLGAGKTTFINKLIGCDFLKENEKCLVIENDFGEINVDSRLLTRQEGLAVSEINSGCVCCSLAGNLESFLREALRTAEPDWVILEPSGAARLSALLQPLEKLQGEGLIRLKPPITILGKPRTAIRQRSFWGVIRNQLEYAGLIVMRPEMKWESVPLPNPDVPVFHMEWDDENFRESIFPFLEEEESHGGRTLETAAEIAAPLMGIAYETIRPDGKYSRGTIREMLECLNRRFGPDLVRLKGFLNGEEGETWHVEYSLFGQKIEKTEGREEACLNIIVSRSRRLELEQYLTQDHRYAKIRI